MHFFPGESKKFKRLAGYEIKSMRLIFKTKMLIFQSTANSDEKILFGKITHHLDLDITKMLVRSIFGNKDGAKMLERTANYYCGLGRS